MYRIIISVLLYLGAVSTAPQDSNVTFVKILPLLDDAAPQNVTIRQSRQENPTPTTATNASTLQNDEVNSTSGQDDATTDLAELDTTTEVTTKREGRVTSPRTLNRKFTKPSPRFISKLGYYNKAEQFNSISTNLVEKSAKLSKRRYKSRCRCERISNCPKLQITVPRCPEEYFICCF